MIAPKPLRRNPDLDRLERPTDLTIAAGFTFSDGILICADSEVSDSLAKFKESKIRTVTIGNNETKLIFAFAGTVPYVKRAIEYCWKGIGEIPAGERTNDSIRDRIEERLDQFHQKFVYPHPQYKYDPGAIAQLLIGVWPRCTGRPTLYVTYEGVVNEVSEYDAIGTGSYFARYTCANLWQRNMSLQRAILLAAHMLQQTKNNVPGCGKSSAIIYLQVGGVLESASPIDINGIEEYSDRFVKFMSRIVLDVVDPNVSLGEQLAIFNKTAEEFREQNFRMNQIYKSLSSTLKNAIKAASPSQEEKNG